MRILGIILIVAGVIGLAYGGFSYTRRRDTVQLGPLSATITQRESVPIPPILGGIALIGGIALLFLGKRKGA
jgi:LPXTG-motif cell wall-anchored protein